MREHPAACDCGRCAAERTMLAQMLGEPEPATRPPAPPTPGPVVGDIPHILVKFKAEMERKIAELCGLPPTMWSGSAPTQPNVPLCVWHQFRGQGLMITSDDVPPTLDVFVIDKTRNLSPTPRQLIDRLLHDGKRFLVLVRPNVKAELMADHASEDDLTAFLIWTGFQISGQRP